MKNRVLFIILFAFTCFVKAQNVRDSSLRVSIIGAHFSVQMPFADLQKRYGFNLCAGGNYLYKLKNNWIFGIDANYFFGSKIKEDVLAGMKNKEGSITNSNGNPGTYRLNERGLILNLTLGHLLNFWNRNKNSGPYIGAGLGYMQHKIFIYDVGRNLPQVNGDFKKGYDRLSGGPNLSVQAGYFLLSSRRFANAYAGLDIHTAYTKGLRGFQYDTMMPDDEKRIDILVGFRLAWMIPLYKRLSKEQYFY